MLKVESCCVDSYRFHTVSFIYFWFCVGKHFGCAQLQENVKHSQFMTEGFIEILQDGDFRMFVTDIQANVACTGVLLIQA